MLFPRLYVSDDFHPHAALIARYGTRTMIRKNTILHDANGATRTSYFIRDGVARLSYVNDEGTEGTLFFLGRGSIYPVNVREEMLSTENYLQLVSVTDLDVVRFPAMRILDMCESSIDFTRAVINHYVRYTNVLLTKQILSSYNNSTQLVSALLFLYAQERPNDDGLVDLTQEQIAQVTGLSRTQVTRVLGVLRADGVVQTHRGKLMIVDLEGLRARHTRISNLI